MSYRITPDETHDRINDSLISTMKSGAYWFYWIAALSVINSLITLYGGNLNFIVGLGITQYIDGVTVSWVASGFPGFIAYIGLIINLVIAAIFVGFGFSATKGSASAFIAGILL